MPDFSLQQQHYSSRVNRFIAQAIDTLPFTHSLLLEAMRYGTLLGGKRIRPYIVYATGQMLGAEAEDLDPAAAAIECIHAYSLIHDDLPAMDNDDLRRGQPTCHIKYGEAHAILAGDALQTLAFSILATSPMPHVSSQQRVEMIAELAQSSGASGMCAGQALDLEAEDQQITLPELELIHRHKTGIIIRAATRLAALTAGPHNPVLVSILDRFSSAIGLAFQVQDDILDIIGDSTKIGKPQGSDMQAGKSTYPALLGLQSAQQKALDLHRDAIAVLCELSNMGYDTQPLKQLTDFIIERDN